MATGLSCRPSAEPFVCRGEVGNRPARTLSEILAPVPVDRFLDEHDGRMPLVVRGWPGKLDGLMSWNDLNVALRAAHLEWLSPEIEGTTPRDRVLATVDGKILDPDEFFTEIESLRRNRVRRIDPVRLTALLRRRATLMVREVEYLVPAVNELADQLERDLGDPVLVLAIASFTPTQGIGIHTDEQDGLILQLEGRKRWQMWEPTRRAPVHNDVMLAPRPVDDPVIDVVLEPGDVVYVPRGWFHAVSAPAEPTLHLTINLYKRTGLDVLEWIVRQLRDDEQLRQDLPRHGTPEARGNHGRRIVSVLVGLLGDGSEVVDRYLADWDGAATPRRPTFSLPWSARRDNIFDDGLFVRLLAPRGLQEVERSAEAVSFVVGSQRWMLTPHQFAALEPLLPGVAVPLARVRRHAAGILHEPDVDALLVDLLLAGKLAVDAPASAADDE